MMGPFNHPNYRYQARDDRERILNAPMFAGDGDAKFGLQKPSLANCKPMLARSDFVFNLRSSMWWGEREGL